MTVAPAIRPYLDLWPLPNGPRLVGGIGTLYASANSPINENYFLVRADHHINDQQSMFARVTFDQGDLVSPDAVPIFTSHIGAHSRYSTVEHDLIVSPRFLMTTRVAYNRTYLSSSETPLINYPSNLNLFLPGWLPTLSFPGVTTLGPGYQNLIRRAQNLYDFEENAQYIHGNHSMRFGTQIDHVGTNKGGELIGINGSFTWNSLQDFLADNRLAAFSAIVPGSDTTRSFAQYIYGTYFQDDWKMRPNFTWNLGLRYEPFTSPTEKYGRESMVENWVTATQFQTNIGLFKNPSKKNFSPRVGFAWDPKGDGKTAIRAGFGLFFVDLLGPYYITPGQKNPPVVGAIASAVGNGTLGSAVSDVTRVAASVLNPILTPNTAMELIQWNLKPSYEIKSNIAVERQLPGNVSVSVGYMGDRGIHLWRFSDANAAPPILVNGRPFVPAGTPRLNPNAGIGTIRYSDAQSFYNGLQIEVKKRFSHGLQIQSSYTYSKNVDDSTTGVAYTDYTPGGTGGNGINSQPYNPKSDRGLSSLDLRHTLAINGIYAFPSPAHSAFSSELLGGWQVAGIFMANSGVPFSVFVSGRNAPDLSRNTGQQRPELVAGRSSGSLMTGNPNHLFDTTAFTLPPPGFYGNAGRNILIGPGLMNFDFSLQKNTSLGIWEASRLEFHADFFNLFNRSNFAIPRGPQLQILNPATGASIPGAGQVTGTVTTARQLQFGLKLVF